MASTGLLPASAYLETSLAVTSSLPNATNLVPSTVSGDPAISSDCVGSPVSSRGLVGNVVSGGVGNCGSDSRFLSNDGGVDKLSRNLSSGQLVGKLLS